MSWCIQIRRRVLRSAVFLFCAIFGFTAFRDATAADDASVVFCAYNLKNWLTMPRGGSGETSAPLPKPESERAQAIDFLKQIRPDILGVCEIGSREDLLDLQTRLRAVGVDLPHTEHVQGADPIRSLALLSRFPIRSRQSQPSLFYQIGELHLPVQRGFLDVTLAISPELEVRFVGVHLKSKRDTPEADQSLMRRNEAHLLRRHLDRIFAQQSLTQLVCYGDFNEHRNEPALAEILGSRASPGHLTDLLLRDREGQVWTHFWDAADVYARIDYCLISRALRPYVNLRQSYVFSARHFDKASDHRPIVMTLRPTLVRPTSSSQ